MTPEETGKKHDPRSATWFKPGQSGNPSGRPKGAVNNDWSKMSYWMQKVQNEWDKLTSKDRAHLSVEIWKVLAARRALPPETPEESVKNVNDLMGKLGQIEKGEEVNDRS